jgi:hypothetical protein
MMLLSRACWVLLAAIHVLPAAGLVFASLRHRLYGVDPSGDIAILLAHRALIFGAIVVMSLAAAIFETWRPTAALVVSVSVIGFLIVYMLDGSPAGPLRQIALVDGAALLLLAIVWTDMARQ